MVEEFKGRRVEAAHFQSRDHFHSSTRLPLHKAKNDSH